MILQYLIAFYNFFPNAFNAFVNFLKDLPLIIYDKVVTVFLGYYDALRTSVDCCFQNPGFSGNVGSATSAVQGYFDAAMSYSPILYYITDKTGIVQGLACLSTAVLFRLTMKVITLGRW